MTDAERTAIGLKLAFAAGYCLPAVILGAIWGWIKFSVRSWWISTLFLLGITAIIFLAHGL
jgi:hypothetical protein